MVDITGTISKATEIAFLIDTTGSMKPAIDDVRKHIEKTCEELFKDIPGLKVGFISHGDYCDGANCYALQPLTDDQPKVFSFIRNSPATSGGDAPECYELVLNLSKTLGWSDSKGGKVVVIIGDDEPHDVDYPGNKDKLDWRKELRDLKELGINVYPLQCLYKSYVKDGVNAFWSEIGEIMNTPLLKLDNFEETSQAINSFAYASGGTAAYAAYEKKLCVSGLNMSDNIKTMNAILRSETPKYDVIEELPPEPEMTIKSDVKIEEVPVKKTRGRPKKKKT